MREEAERLELARVSPKYILIAEPHAATARALTAALTASTGLPCQVTTEGYAAHEVLLKQGIPAILVTNLVLARRDGFALIRTLRKLDRQRQVPVVSYAAPPQVRQTAESYRADLGPMEVIGGPPQPAAVLRALSTATAAVRPPQEVAASPSPPPPAPAPPPPPAPAPPAPPAPAPPAPALPGRPTALAAGPSPEQREAARLARIEAMKLVDSSPPDPELQRMVTEVAHTFGAPTALVSVLLEGKLWFKAHTGLQGKAQDERSIPRALSFCQHVVEGGEALVIPDAREHPLFASNPMVQAGEVGGYAGAPLTTSQGEVLGALCITNAGPLDIGPGDLEQLSLLARRMTGELELRAARQHLLEARPASPPADPSPPPAPPARATLPSAAPLPFSRSRTAPTATPPAPPPPARNRTTPGVGPTTPAPTADTPATAFASSPITSPAAASPPAPLAPAAAPGEPPAAGSASERQVVIAALQVALAPLPCPTIVFDHQRRALFANDAFYRLFGLRKGTLAGISRSVVLARLSDRLLDPEDALARLMVPPSGPFALRERLDLRGPHGAAIWWASSPLPLPGGELQITSVTAAGPSD